MGKEQVGIQITGDLGGLRAEVETFDRTAIVPREQRIDRLRSRLTDVEARSSSFESRLERQEFRVAKTFARGALTSAALGGLDSLGLNSSLTGRVASTAITSGLFSPGSLVEKIGAGTAGAIAAGVIELAAEVKRMIARYDQMVEITRSLEATQLQLKFDAQKAATERRFADLAFEAKISRTKREVLNDSLYEMWRYVEEG